VLVGIAGALLYRRAGVGRPAKAPVAPAIPPGDLGTIGVAAMGGLADTPSGKMGRAAGAREAAQALTETQIAAESQEQPEPELVD
jgi:hypothetical protein